MHCSLNFWNIYGIIERMLNSPLKIMTEFLVNEDTAVFVAAAAAVVGELIWLFISLHMYTTLLLSDKFSVYCFYLSPFHFFLLHKSIKVFSTNLLLFEFSIFPFVI